MTWTILLGIRQDHRGRHYRIAVNSRGAQDVVYYQAEGAPPARLIQAPPEPPRRPLLTMKGYDMKQRRMRVDFRVRGETEVRTLQDVSSVAQAFVDQHRADAHTYFRPIAEGGGEEYFRARSDMLEGGELILRCASDWDWFVQRHLDIKEEQ